MALNAHTVNPHLNPPPLGEEINTRIFPLETNHLIAIVFCASIMG